MLKVASVVLLLLRTTSLVHHRERLHVWLQHGPLFGLVTLCASCAIYNALPQCVMANMPTLDQPWLMRVETLPSTGFVSLWSDTIVLLACNWPLFLSHMSICALFSSFSGYSTHLLFCLFFLFILWILCDSFHPASLSSFDTEVISETSTRDAKLMLKRRI